MPHRRRRDNKWMIGKEQKDKQWWAKYYTEY